jgi:hypothetical protein
MKLFLIIGGLFIIIFVCIIPLRRTFEKYNTQINGQLITATITYIPNCLGTKVRHFMKFTYSGQEFDKVVGCGFSDAHKVGDTIKLKHTDGTDIFLFETENIKTDLISTSILALVGLSFIIYGFKKTKNQIDIRNV